MKKIAVAAVLACAANLCAAQASPWTFFVKVGQNFGDNSSEVAGGDYQNGGRFSIKAGNGNAFAGGVGYALNPDYDLSVGLGYEKTTTAASNGELAFTRMPVELMVFRNVGGNWRFGAGARILNGAKLETSGVVAGNDKTYDASTGVVLEAQFLTQRGGNPYGRFGASIRLVADRYDGKAVTSQPAYFELTNPPFSGNHLGVSLIYMY